ncbi:MULTISPECIES: hypothetical protein [Prochlorococcus]|nr:MULTISPECIES: hypothetical protein [Prochlorococcus]KGG14074.1 hypothetical protein EV04_0559 [Prochlorococcus marinus str. LG]KGG20757.1 hypothetical protein EV08_0961 [Prochlorococcus marinus str. SS2]KGG25158.1 hypothetical protein EV09_0052 [Prochlorococcus marinus str. SS35]KGG33290.1 hypothetical protein EV10_0497 [Prochlorococcus marinus str. SS51]KGG35603.1 hypothetical protein EV11_1167 [Prochlorococcus sp. SS52]
MEITSELVGNPITLLLERVAYFLIGCFFVVALYRGVKRGNQDRK